MKLDEPVIGFYALSGESVIQFPVSQTKEQICGCLAHQLGIDFVFLPVGSPDINPIEQVWKSLKWEASPLIVESAAEYHDLLTQLFEQLTTRLSFAASWI